MESPATLKQLTKTRQRNELLSEKLSSQNERCKQLEDQIRKSDEYSCNLQHKVTRDNIGFTFYWFGINKIGFEVDSGTHRHTQADKSDFNMLEK